MALSVRKIERASKLATVNFRTEDETLALIDRAAKVLGKTRTAFVMENAVAAATDVILDQQLFSLDPSAMKKFQDILDAPPRKLPELRKLMSKRAMWE